MPLIVQWGRVKELCQHEANSLFAPHTYQPLDDDHAIFADLDWPQAQAMIEQSAGVVKALKVMKDLPLATTKTELIAQIVNDLKSFDHLTFSLFTNTLPYSVSAVDIKDQLKASNVKSRFIDSHGKRGLSAAILTHQQVIEIGLFADGQQILIAQTVWAQPIDNWTRKDVGKPHRDHKRGMLPAKLAHQMINLVSPELRNQADRYLYDPFCGTGTVLIEALELGWQVAGSDIARQAISNTAENLHYFTNLQSSQVKAAEPRLFIADATQVKLENLGRKVTAIITEPFLGKPTPQPHELANQFKGLEKLYWGTFKRWTQLLADGAEVVIVTPLVEIDKIHFDLRKIIDKTPTLGYSILSGPHIYRRPQTIVQRAIYHLKFKNN